MLTAIPVHTHPVPRMGCLSRELVFVEETPGEKAVRGGVGGGQVLQGAQGKGLRSQN